MRRTPAVALVGLLLGLSGCAGVPQRLGWSSPATDRSDPADTSAPSRLSWWRRPRAENSTTGPSYQNRRNPRNHPAGSVHQIADRRVAGVAVRVARATFPAFESTLERTDGVSRG